MPLSYSFNYISLVSNVPMPPNGQLELFQMRGPIVDNSSFNFVLEVKQVMASIGVPKTDESYFHMQYTARNAVKISLVKPIQGPQDIELNLQMNVSINGTYSGYTVSKLFVLVSQYDF